MKEPDYKTLPARQLRAELKREKTNWKSLPRKDSFSGLAVSGRLERIQQELDRRGLSFEPIYMEINIGVG